MINLITGTKDKYRQGRSLKICRPLHSDVYFSELPDSECLPMLRFLQTHGNTVTYQWTHGCKPVSVQQADVVIDTKDEEEAEDPTDVSFTLSLTIILTVLLAVVGNSFDFKDFVVSSPTSSHLLLYLQFYSVGVGFL